MESSITPRGRWWAARNYLLGLCLGGMGAALFWHFYLGSWKEAPVEESATATVQRRAALLAEAQPTLAAMADQAPLPPPTACAFEPLIPPRGAADGRLRMEHPFPAGPRAKAKVFLRAAEKAAAGGRPRDEEVALIAACRYSDEASTKPTLPLARVLGALGDRYVSAAGDERLSAQREQLLARATEVLTLSADTYAKALGPNAPRSREARQRVADLTQAVIVASDAAPEPAPRAPVLQASVQTERAEPPRKTAAPRAPAPRAAVQAREPADPQLQQLARDLARLRAQAEAVSDDPEGLRRRAEQAQAQRAQCPDAACLRDWYARRRQQLFAEF